MATASVGIVSLLHQNTVAQKNICSVLGYFVNGERLCSFLMLYSVIKVSLNLRLILKFAYLTEIDLQNYRSTRRLNCSIRNRGQIPLSASSYIDTSDELVQKWRDRAKPVSILTVRTDVDFQTSERTLWNRLFRTKSLEEWGQGWVNESKLKKIRLSRVFA